MNANVFVGASVTAGSPNQTEASRRDGKPFAAIYRHAAYLYAVAGMRDEAIRIAALARKAGRAAFFLPFLADAELVEALGAAPELQELLNASS